MRPLFSWRNWVDERGVVISATSETDGLGVSNLVTDQVAGDVWRATYSGGTVHLRADLGTLREIGAVGLFLPRDGVQPLQSDRVRIRLSATTVDGTDILDTGAIGMSFDTGTWGGWVYPLAAGIRPNLIYNPSARDSSTGWQAVSSLTNISFATGTGTNALRDVGGIAGVWNGSGAPINSSVAAYFLTSGIPMPANTEVELSALVSGTWCRPYIGIVAVDAALGGLGVAQSAFLAARTGQWKAQISEWSRVSLRYVTPANTARILPFGAGATDGSGNNPQLYAAEAACYVADPTGTTPIFSDHYIGLNSNIAALEAVNFARYVTVSITSAQSYLDIGRLWIGPAFVGANGPDSDSAEARDAGETVRAQPSGITFSQRGGVYRARSMRLPLLTEREARRLDIAAEYAGRGQVLAIRDVLRAKDTAMLGRLTQAPAPVRTLPTYWAASISVEEDV